MINPEDLVFALSDDLVKLYDELFMVIHKQAILPPNLKRITDSDVFGRAKTLPYMWQHADDET